MRFGFLLVFQLLSAGFFTTTLRGQSRLPVPFQHESSGKWGYKDAATGQVLIYWHFDAADSFDQQGFARITYQHRQSFIDTAGSLIFPLVFPFVSATFDDTIYLNAEHTRYIAKSGQQYYEYKKQKEAMVRISELPVSDYYGRQLTIVRFQYPRDQDKFDRMSHEAAEKKMYPIVSHAGSLEFRWSPTIFGQSINKIEPELPGRSHHLAITRFFQTKKGLDGFGLSTGFINSKYWLDTAIYRQNQIVLGLFQRVNLSSVFYFEMGVAPVVNQTLSRYNKLDDTWLAANKPWSGISSVYELNAGFNISRMLRLGMGYKYVPSALQHPRLPRHFFTFSFGLVFGDDTNISQN